MPTNLDLNDRLILEAQKLGGFKSKKQAVNAALAEFVRRHRQVGIIKLFGTVDFDPRWDYKKARRRRP